MSAENNTPQWMIFPDFPIPDQYLEMVKDWVSQYTDAAERPDAYEAEVGVKFDPNGVIIGYVATVIEWASTIRAAAGPSANVDESAKRILQYGQNLWMYTMWYSSQTGAVVPINGNGFLLGVGALAQTIDQKEIAEVLSTTATNLLSAIIGKLIEYAEAPENNPILAELPDEAEILKQIQYLQNKGDTEILAEFFQTFQDLGTFKRDPSEYKTDEERQLYYKLLGLYYKVMGK